MIYYLYTLKFSTAVHFGAAHNGGKLESTDIFCAADTFFSALCQEAAAMGTDKVDRLIKAVQTDAIKFSSLLPYYNNNSEFELYLPKPLLISNSGNREVKNLQAVKKEATLLKQSKKANYLRVGRLKEYFTAQATGKMFDFALPQFAMKMNAERVNMRGEKPLPYFVGGYRFTDIDEDNYAGLYFVAAFKNEDAVENFTNLVMQLGLSGIGGKRSSGYGKFTLADDPLELLEGDCIYEDTEALIQLLQAKDAAWQMNLAPVLPDVQDVATVKNGYYKLQKRSGFVSSDNSNRKRNNIYMLAEGSCLTQRLAGNLLAEEMDGINHKIYRYGKGLFVGFDYGEK